nr:hypothetical protein [Tanacetum cinerariifolium]
SPPPCLMIQHQGLLPLLLMRAAQEEEIRRLKERVQVLEDREGVATKQSGEDAPIKRRSNNEGNAAAERISNDSEEIARVLTSMDAATVLAGETDVPTGKIEVKFAEVWKQVEDFIPMGSKEECERLKRKGLNLEKEQVKKQKSSEEPPEIETITK